MSDRDHAEEDEELLRQALHDLAASDGPAPPVAAPALMARGRRTRGRRRATVAACATALVALGGSALGLNLAGGEGGDGSSRASTAAVRTPSGAVIGEKYTYALPGVCDLRVALFDGRLWTAPPHSTWAIQLAGPYLTRPMTLRSKDTLRFGGVSGVPWMTFHPADQADVDAVAPGCLDRLESDVEKPKAGVLYPLQLGGGPSCGKGPDVVRLGGRWWASDEKTPKDAWKPSPPGTVQLLAPDIAEVSYLGGRTATFRPLDDGPGPCA
ncbi:hypothetical protein [Streptomyces sp. NBC_01465]|uniref:hypothetical protein n=1 Tax=Streptomyces sp. NBC_01465 TaxID=2903878 RepID=UPI002E2EC2FF|nr:hypothetical protein [Streptomyces sp. NBC_01465]